MNEEEGFCLGLIFNAEYTEKLLYICEEMEETPIELLQRSINTMSKRLEAMRGE